jgi:hypothetical protein
MPSYDILPGVLDLAVIKGDEFPLTANFNVNLTGYTVVCSVVDTSNDTPVVTTSVSISGGTTAIFKFNHTQTSMLSTASKYRWNMKWTAPGGDVRTVLAGRVKVQTP